MSSEDSPKMKLSNIHREKLISLLKRMMDQERATVAISPYQQQEGFWFGGGNVVVEDDCLWLVGRFRNFGDSRTGLKAGLRGLECALFRSDNQGKSWEKVHSWTKTQLSQFSESKILSIEGTDLHRLKDGNWELFISSEKEVKYPVDLASYQKPGTGIWSLDSLRAPSVLELHPRTLTPLHLRGHPDLQGEAENEEREAVHLHLKDPVLFDIESKSHVTALFFCTHPYSWTSSNTAMAIRTTLPTKPTPTKEDFRVDTWQVVGRGSAWDVAVTRITCRIPIPHLGIFASLPPCSVYLYDGAECVREHQQSQKGHHRARGYSCEEIGGAFFGWDHEFPSLTRLSDLSPFFESHQGTGCSRYASGTFLPSGFLMTWQQSQNDKSQPLVSHFLPMAEIETILSKD